MLALNDKFQNNISKITPASLNTTICFECNRSYFICIIKSFLLWRPYTVAMYH